MVERNRMPSLVELVSSIMQLIGILAVCEFFSSLSLSKERLLLVRYTLWIGADCDCLVSPSLGVMVVGSVVAGFSYSVALTTVFSFFLKEFQPISLIRQRSSKSLDVALVPYHTFHS